MAVLTKPYLSINSVDLSAYVRSVNPSFDLDEIEATCGNATGTKSFEAGLEGWSIDVTFKQAFGAGLVHETLRAANKTGVAIELRPTTDAVGTGNPKVTGTALVKYQAPFGGQVGSLLEARCTLRGTGAYTWATA